MKYRIIPVFDMSEMYQLEYKTFWGWKFVALGSKEALLKLHKHLTQPPVEL